MLFYNNYKMGRIMNGYTLICFAFGTFFGMIIAENTQNYLQRRNRSLNTNSYVIITLGIGLIASVIVNIAL